MGADGDDGDVAADIAAATPENAEQLKRFGLWSIVIGLAIGILPHFWELIGANWIHLTGNADVQPFASTITGEFIWLCFFLMIIFVSFGISLLFVAYMGLSVVLEINNPFSAKGVAKVGNAFAAFLILVTGAYFATVDVHEPMRERRDRAVAIAELNDEIENLKDEKAALEAKLETFEPYKQFVSYLMKGDEQNPGMRISTKIARDPPESWREPEQIDGHLMNEEELAEKVASGRVPLSDEDTSNGYAVTTSSQKLFYWDNKRDKPISYFDIAFTDDFKLDVELVVYDAFCAETEPANQGFSARQQAGPLGGVEKEG